MSLNWKCRSFLEMILSTSLIGFTMLGYFLATILRPRPMLLTPSLARVVISCRSAQKWIAKIEEVNAELAPSRSRMKRSSDRLISRVRLAGRTSPGDG
jgi:hypothetical protein